jgi:ABC-type dipeptide/oligopeptide/nickel transport system permease component
MIKFIFKKLVYGLVVILGVMLIVFLIFHTLPGDPVEDIMGKHPSAEDRALLNREFGFDKPLYVQFFMYCNDFSPISVHENTEENQKKYQYLTSVSIGGNVLAIKYPYLRRTINNRKVSDLLLENLEGTLWLSAVAMCIATVFGIGLGLTAALRKDSLTDRIIVAFSVIWFSTPSFVMAILIATIFGYYLSDITGLDVKGYFIDSETKKIIVKNLILPSITLSLRPLAIIIQLTRNSMLEVLSQDYIRTARAKGLPKWMIVGKHALRNAMNPVITAVSGWFAALMTGAFFIEHLFVLKGLGFVTISAVYSKDFPIVMAATIIIAAIFVFINILVDIFYALTDPRIRLS